MIGGMVWDPVIREWMWLRDYIAANRTATWPAPLAPRATS